MKLKTLHEKHEASDVEAMQEAMDLVSEYLKENGIGHYSGWTHLDIPKHRAKLLFYDGGNIEIKRDAYLGLWVNITDPESFPKILKYLRGDR